MNPQQVLRPLLFLLIIIMNATVLAQPQWRLAQGTQHTSAQGFDKADNDHLRADYQKHMLEQLTFDSQPPLQDSSLDYLGRWGWGQCGGVAVMGNYILTGSGPTLLWLDGSDRHKPQIIWETLTNGTLSNFIIRDSIGYALLSAYSLLIVDLRNPSVPVIRAEFPITFGLLSLAVTDSLVFVKRYLQYVYCVDVSDPSTPFLRATIRETTTQWGKLAISNRNLYVGDQNGFTEHLDVSNPDSVRNTVLSNVASTVTAAYAKDTLLLLGNFGNRLYIYSIATPASPVQLSNASIGISGITSITLKGDTAFAGTIDGRVVAVDVTDKRNPVFLGSYTPPIIQPELSAGFLATQDTTLYCSVWNGLTTFSTANPASMSVLSFFPTGYQSNKIVVKNNLAYVTSGYAGLWVVDFSDPTRPQRLENIAIPGYAYDLVMDSTIGYVSVNHPFYLLNQDGPNKLLSLDMTRPDSLRILDSFIMGSPYNMSKSGSLLLVTQANSINPPLDSTLTIFDVSDPSNIILISQTAAGNVREIASRDSIAFLAISSAIGHPPPSLKILDCTNPANPQLLSTTPTNALGVSINGDFAYVHRGDSTFVVNVANLTAPVVVSRLRHLGPNYLGAIESFTKDGRVYWASPGEFGIIDVANPYEPRILFEIETFGQGGIAVVGDTIYITRADGVWIYKYNRGPTSVPNQEGPISRAVHLFPNYPNPFNATTQLRFAADSREDVRVDVYNLLGQHVRSLFKGVVDTGEQTLEFDATGLPSGAYFYKLQTPVTVNVGRMMLIK